MTSYNRTLQIGRKARVFAGILVLAMGINMATPRQAHATGMMVSWGICSLTMAYPALFNACSSIAASAIAQAIGSVIDTLIPGFVTRIQILTGQRLARAQMTNQQSLVLNENIAEQTIENTPGVTRARCSVAGVATLGGGAVPLGPDQVAPRPRTRVTTEGRFPRITGTPDEAVPAALRERFISEQLSNALMERRTDPRPGTAKAIIDHQSTKIWRSCDELPEAERAPCREAQEAAGARTYADISAESLLGTETYSGATQEERDMRASEAAAYCANLMVPDGQDRVTSASSSDAMIADATQRGGDARTALASKVCSDMVARRVGQAFDSTNPAFNWVVSAACSYRRAFTGLRDATNLSGEFRSVLDGACGGDAGSGDSDLYLSRLELMRIMARDIFATEKFNVNNASSNPTELQRMMIGMESINAQLNFETLRLQEQLGLVQAARLAASIGGR